MATGPEHYRLAEEHIGYAQASHAPDVEALHLGYAQAHATLALAAATVIAAIAGSRADAEGDLWLDTITAPVTFGGNAGGTEVSP